MPTNITKKDVELVFGYMSETAKEEITSYIDMTNEDAYNWMKLACPDYVKKSADIWMSIVSALDKADYTVKQKVQDYIQSTLKMEDLYIFDKTNAESLPKLARYVARVSSVFDSYDKWWTKTDAQLLPQSYKEPEQQILSKIDDEKKQIIDVMENYLGIFILIEKANFYITRSNAKEWMNLLEIIKIFAPEKKKAVSNIPTNPSRLPRNNRAFGYDKEMVDTFTGLLTYEKKMLEIIKERKLKKEEEQKQKDKQDRMNMMLQVLLQNGLEVGKDFDVNHDSISRAYKQLNKGV